jgi:hypothetical protein
MSAARLEQVTTGRVVLIAIAVVVAIVYLPGCGSQAGEATSDPGARNRTATDKEPFVSKPPDSTLAHGGRTVTGELGSYCWSSPGSPATCADAAGIPLPRKQQALTVPTGSVLMFDYGGGQGKLDSVEAKAYPLKQEKQWLPGPEGTRLMRPKGGRSLLATEVLRVHQEGDRIAIPAELSSEEYVVEVLVLVPEGDASMRRHCLSRPTWRPLRGRAQRLCPSPCFHPHSQ